MWWTAYGGASVMTEMRSYGVAIRIEGGDHVVSVRDVPEVVTSGDSIAEALTLAADAIAVAVACRLAEGSSLPEPSPIEAGEHPIGLPADLAAREHC